MDWLDDNRAGRGGGRAASGGACYHLSFRSGSRATGACAARPSFDYITRRRRVRRSRPRPRDLCRVGPHAVVGGDDPGAYWDAADLYERANGRLYVSADFALPRDLSAEDQIDLAHDFAPELTRDERLPYTLAIHAGRDDDGHEHNPHAHLMFSERANDGIERTREQWFARANREDPDRGGAPKSRTFHGRAWVEQSRERLAALTNQTLERLGREERVDHRSYARQGRDGEPGRHFGPVAAHLVSRGRAHDGIEGAAQAVTDQYRLETLDRAIGDVETERQALLVSEQKRLDWEWASDGGAGRGGGVTRDHDDDRTR